MSSPSPTENLPPEIEPVSTERPDAPSLKFPGFWRDAWQHFKKRRLAYVAFWFVMLLGLIAVFSPAIVGTKPIICEYKGNIYFPAMGYFIPSWENGIFISDAVIVNYPKRLKENDPNSWAVWPLVYQDPLRRIRANEWKDQPANPDDAAPPSRWNFFGVNDVGEDVFAKMVHGTRIALLVGFVSTGLATIIGLAVGAIAGFFGGWIDLLISRLIEIVMCIPTLILILALVAIVEKPTIWHLMVVIGVTGWTGIARFTRGEFMKLKQLEYVSAARSLGASRLRIILRHVLPNALAPVLVPVSFGIAAAILIESTLSFLGVGAPTKTSWGRLLNEGRLNLNNWWLIVFPGAAIFLTVLAYNLIGEGLQEATDPRLRQDSH